MKLEDLVKVFNTTGECEIHVDRVVSVWNKNWGLTQWKTKYNLVKHGSGFDIRISEEQAKALISKLGLVQKQGIFSNGSSWELSQKSEANKLNFKPLKY